MDKIIIAHWKQYPATREEAISLARASDYDSVVICPPSEFLEAVGNVLEKAKLGTQDVFWHSPPAGIAYTLVGHSDQRAKGDTDDGIADKLARAVSAGVIPVLCVGETREQKDRGEKEHVLASHIKIGFSKLSETRNQKSEIWIAYEPVWAISANFEAAADTAHDAVASIAFIKEQLLHFRQVRYLYGGSVTSANAALFLQQPGIEGVLVGGASRDPEEFKKIWETAKKF